MFEYFTEPAKRAITIAQDEATALEHDYIGSEHLLLGLAAVDTGTAGAVLSEHGVTPSRARDEMVRIQRAAGITGGGGRDAVDALATLGIDVEQIRSKADESFGPGRFQFPLPAYSPDAKSMLELTLREAQALGHSSFDTEHMLLGLLAHGEGIGIEVLTALGVDLAALREAIHSRHRPTA